MKSGDSKLPLTDEDKLNDQNSLSEIAEADPDERKYVTRELTKYSVLVAIAQTDVNEAVRKIAIDRLIELFALAKSERLGADAEGDPQEPVEQRIAEYQSILADLARTASDKHVRKAAVEHVRDWELLRTIARADSDRHVRLATVKSLENQEILADIAKGHTMYKSDVCKAAISNICDPDLLSDIALNCHEPTFYQAALERICDCTVLTDIATHATHSDVGTFARRRIRECRQAGTPQAVADAVFELKRDLELPERFERVSAIKTSDDFDVNRYFDVMPDLSMEPEYVLDYVYLCNAAMGYPVLYARRRDTPPYLTYVEYSIAEGNNAHRPTYLDHIRINGSLNGFFQYVVLERLGDQFYLYWHALYNKDIRIVCSHDTLETIWKELSDVFGLDDDHYNSQFVSYHRPRITNMLAKAQSLHFDPVIELRGENVLVQMVTFGKWRGFERESFLISKDFPHRILERTSETLVKYNCGIMF
jgi:hypothetical protein